MGGLGSSGLNIERDHCVLQKRKRKKKETTFARLQTKKEGQVAYCRPWVVHSSDRLTACFVTGPWTKHFVMLPAAWPFQLPDLKWWWWLHCRYPCFENPYPMDLHESPVTACQYYANCPTDLIPAFYSVGSKQKKTGFSEKVAWHWNENAGEMRVFCIRVVLCCLRCESVLYQSCAVLFEVWECFVSRVVLCCLRCESVLCLCYAVWGVGAFCIGVVLFEVWGCFVLELCCAVSGVFLYFLYQSCAVLSEVW